MRLRAVLTTLALISLAWPTVWGRPASSAATLPPGFQDAITHVGLDQPVALDFAADGTLFVGEKRGVIKAFDDLQDTTPSVFADLRTEVHTYNDRGLLGLIVDPAWPTRPYLYVLYSYDAPVGGTAPTYGTVGGNSDPCPLLGGVPRCPATVRVSRLTADQGTMTAETVLLEDVCHEFPAHDGGGLAIGPEGALYASVGEGAWWGVVDYGNMGNACGDPGGPPGTSLTPPTAEGGALRAQDLRTSGDPASVNGAVLRIDPDTGAPWPTNPLIGSADPIARKVLAYGFRNPFRLALRPGTDEPWIADVGGGRAEEVNRFAPAAPVENFGWPCYEGTARNPVYDASDLNLCESLYASGTALPPHHHYCHGAQPPDPATPCPTTTSAAISSLAFYRGGSYPVKYQGALFFADYTMKTLWAMLPGPDGVPDPARVEVFGTGTGNVIDLRSGPGGDLVYNDTWDGTIHRIYVGDPGVPPDPPAQRPTAAIDAPVATTTWAVGDTITFSGHATDHDGTPLPASALSWAFNLLHCYSASDCHRHRIQDFRGVAGGSVEAPDHGYPTKLELVLTATNPSGATDVTSVLLLPRTVDLVFTTDPVGLSLVVDGTAAPSPVRRTAVVGGSVLVDAPSPQRRDGTWEFRGWSDGGPQAHQVTAGASPATYTATFVRTSSK